MSFFDGFEPTTAIAGVVLMLIGLYKFFVQGRLGKDMPEEHQREMTTHERGQVLARLRIWGAVVFALGAFFALGVSRLIN